jgi:hypothetical protein
MRDERERRDGRDRREHRVRHKPTPDVQVETEKIKRALETEVLKREVLEGEKAEASRRHIAKAAGKSLRASKSESPSPTNLTSTGDATISPSEVPTKPSA